MFSCGGARDWRCRSRRRTGGGDMIPKVGAQSRIQHPTAILLPNGRLNGRGPLAPERRSSNLKPAGYVRQLIDAALGAAALGLSRPRRPPTCPTPAASRPTDSPPSHRLGLNDYLLHVDGSAIGAVDETAATPSPVPSWRYEDTATRPNSRGPRRASDNEPDVASLAPIQRVRPRAESWQGYSSVTSCRRE